MLPDWEISVRLVLAAALGSFIGFERERLLASLAFVRDVKAQGRARKFAEG